MSSITNHPPILELKPHQWRGILSDIERGKIVPVIGPELMIIEHEGKSAPFYDLVAEKLVEKLDIDVSGWPPPWTLSQLVYLHRHQVGGDALNEDCYHMIEEIISSNDWPVPPALKKLAEISHFNLFVSTTPDNLMSRALSERMGSKKGPSVYSYSPETELVDLPDSLLSKSLRDEKSPSIFKLFGDLELTPNFAITEEDILRYVHHLQMRDERPANLFDVLKSSSLTLLGCSFENWLIRFLMCSAKRDAVWSPQGARGIIADTKTTKDTQLLPFLYRNRTMLYTNGDSIDFVNELHHHWTERFGSSEPCPEAVDTQIPPETVFISYASEDRDAALRIFEALKAEGISVWLDKDRFKGGEIFESVLSEKIKESAMFLPIISKHTVLTTRSFFRLEWNIAIEDSKRFPESYPFIQPVVIDDTDFHSENIPVEFRRRHVNHFPAGQISPEFPTTLIRSLRRFQKRG